MHLSLNVFTLWMLAALPLLGVSSPAVAQDTLLSPADIQSQWVGKTVGAVIAGGPAAGKTISFNLKADGTAELGGALQDSGTWRLWDQGYCATWKKIRGGKEGCFTVITKAGQTQVVNADGSVNSTVTGVR